MSIVEYVLTRTLMAFVLSIPIGIFVYKKRGLSLDGAIAAIIIGVTVFLTGWQTFIIFLVFFVSSTLLTKWKYSIKKETQAAEITGGRKWTQVVGAGGISSLLAFILIINLLRYDFNPEPPKIVTSLFVSMLTAIAVSNADTWAVEIGAAFNKEPRLVTKPWLKVPAGTSGGISLIGELASISGSLLIAFTTYVLYSLSHVYDLFPWNVFTVEPLMLMVTISVFGWLGEFFDSVVGATLQAKYYCPKCRKLTDKKFHKCGTATQFYSGYKIITNEVTNIIATAIASLLAFIFSFYAL